LSRIRILSEQLANQIAAGEVVERPASVVKELVENSVDAGATRIDIQVEGSGAGLLRIADNGLGMDGDDVLLCIERHATSKLQEEEQLAAIATLGFRGEAIPSIGSVSWMTILSRPREQDLGTRAEIRYGTLQAVHQDGCARGTVIEVRHLFGNMPARRKFLKSARTEMYHVEEVVKNQAMAHPQIGFSLQIDSRVVLEYPPEADLERRVREVFRYQGKLLSLGSDETSESGEMHIAGYLLLPEMAQAGNARLRILVNNRPVQDAMIRHAVSEGLQSFLMKGYQPAGALLLTIAPDQVDVNVHPAKREIRFRKSEAVHRFITDRVAEAMGEYQQTLRTSLFAPASPVQGRTQQPLERPYPPSVSPALSVTTAEPFTSQRSLPPIASSRPPVGHSSVQEQQVPASPAAPSGPPLALSSTATEDFSGLTLIGQLFSLYLLCERDGDFIVIDQHAAHERLLYGQLRQGYLAAKIPRQALMFPVTVELTPVQAETLEARQELVATLGLEADFFGDSTYVIKSVPAVVSQMEPGALLREILDGLRGQVSVEVARPVPQAVDGLLASMACKAAIKAGNRLSPQEMLHLLQQMQAGEVFSHCPHGRPVVKAFSAQEVEKWFYRHGG
jgi:DNA mismatch repair protein MutL